MDYKTPDEIVDLSFDYSANLGDSETISSATVTAHLKKGVDANPENTLFGIATVAGALVYQRVTGGADKNLYVYKCLVDTSIGRRLELDAFLPIVQIAPS